MPPVVHAVVLGLSAKGRKSTALDDAVEILAEPLMPTPARDGEPEPAQVITGLGSGEGFAEAIADQQWWPNGDRDDEGAPEVVTGRRGLFVVHEVAALLEKTERGQAGAMLDFLLAAFDARACWSHRTRKSRDSQPLKITNGIAIFLGASTYSWLAETLSETQVMAGFANRIFWFAGARTCLLPIRPQIPEEGIDALRREVKAALAAVAGKRAYLTPEALEAHRAQYVEDQERSAGSDVADAAVARSDVLAVRLAMLLTIAECGTEIGREHIEDAWSVVRYSQAVVTGLVTRIRERTMRAVEARLLDAARRVAEEGDGTFTQRAVRQRVKGRTGMDAETFLRSWSSLVSTQDIVPNGSPTTFKLGAP